MTIAKPTTAAEASKLISELETKRAKLTGMVNSSAERRKGHVVAAEFGDTAAKETLSKIAAEDTQARTALENLDVVIGEMRQLHGRLRAAEAEKAAEQHAEQLSAAIDELLAKDDECDAALDHARELLERRRELARNPILRSAPHRFAGALVVREREVGASILAYFDRELFFVDRQGAGYPGIVRVADWDARHFGKQSPGQVARGPRPLTPSEKAMRRHEPPAMTKTFGHDSQTEHATWLANGGIGRKPVRDVSGGWSADA